MVTNPEKFSKEKIFGPRDSEKDKRISRFQKRVYDLAKKIPRGKVTTYKAIAEKLNTSPRAVGQALKRNPFLTNMPCHRVIRSDGSLGGYKGKMNSKIKKNLLKKEGVDIKFRKF